MTGAIMLITDVLFGALPTVIASAVSLSVFVLLWYAHSEVQLPGAGLGLERDL